MNCLEAVNIILGEENIVVKSEENYLKMGTEMFDSERVNVVQSLEVLFSGGALFCVTSDSKQLIVLPTLISEDPNHVAFAIHEAFHAKRWREGTAIKPTTVEAFLVTPSGRIYHLIPTWFNTIRSVLRTWKEENATNREATEFVKEHLQGEDLEAALHVFRSSNMGYHPLVLIQVKITTKLMFTRANKILFPLMLHMLNCMSKKKTGRDFTTEFAAYQARLMNIPELEANREEVTPEFKLLPNTDIDTDGLGDWKIP
jgi:hypothetical protein